MKKVAEIMKQTATGTCVQAFKFDAGNSIPNCLDPKKACSAQKVCNTGSHLTWCQMSTLNHEIGSAKMAKGLWFRNMEPLRPSSLPLAGRKEICRALRRLAPDFEDVAVRVRPSAWSPLSPPEPGTTSKAPLPGPSSQSKRPLPQLAAASAKPQASVAVPIRSSSARIRPRLPPPKKRNAAEAGMPDPSESGFTGSVGSASSL